MATKKLGTSGVLKIGGTKSIATGTAVPLLKSADFSITNNEVDDTDNDSTGAWNEFLMGNRTGTFSFTFNWDSALTGGGTVPQEIFATNIAGTNTALAFVYFPGGAIIGQRTYAFSAFVSEVTHNAANESVLEVSVTARITGAVVVDTATA